MTFRLAATLAVALAIPLAASSVPAQFEGVADMKFASSANGDKVEGKGRLFLTPSAWRMEADFGSSRAPGAETQGAPDGKQAFRVVVLGKAAEPKKSWMLNDRTKTYAVVDADNANRGGSGSGGEWNISRVGKDKVAGLACEKVKASRKGEDETWEGCLAPDFLSSAWMRALTESEEEGWIVAAQRAGVKGYPVRMISRGTDGKENQRFEIVKVERRRLPAALFEVPAGYKETSVMGTMAQNPEQQRQLEEAHRQAQEAMKDMSPEQKKAMEEMMRHYGGKPQ